MKNLARICLLFVSINFGSAALAQDCFADYKAKKDGPLRLHYGVLELRSGCSKSAARQEVGERLSAKGWILLNIVSVFGPDGLEQRKDSAGKFFLRF